MGSAKTVCTVIGSYLTDSSGRRPLLIASSLGIVLSLLVMAFGFTAAVPNPNVQVAGSVLFTCWFAIGWGPVAWLTVSELYPLRIRGRAMGLSALVNRSTSTALAMVFLFLQEKSPAGLWFGLAFIAVASLVFVYNFLPETKGVPLEQVPGLFKEPGDGDGGGDGDGEGDSEQHGAVRREADVLASFESDEVTTTAGV